MDTICLTLCLFFFSGGQVAKLYRDASLGNVVNIIVTRLIVLTEDQVRRITRMPYCLLAVCGVATFTTVLACTPARRKSMAAFTWGYSVLMHFLLIRYHIISYEPIYPTALIPFSKMLTGLFPLCSPTWR